jgi:hypothetical protein
MKAPYPNAEGRLRLGGIKLSLEMVQLNCLDRPGANLRATRLFGLMAENRINLPFVVLSSTTRNTVCSCCLESEDFHRAQGLLERDPDLSSSVEKIAPVGTVTFFPHQSSLQLLGVVMAVFGKAGLPVYGTGTSLSALTVSTDYRLLDQALGALEKVLELPAHHTPFRPEFRIRQM